MSFQRTLAALPDVVWRYVTWPEYMNQWSEGSVKLVSGGAEGRADVVGAVRRVTVIVLGLHFQLTEVVEESIPPARFVYRVISGGGLREHRGVMALDHLPNGTRLSWEVTYRARLPLLGLLMRWVIGTAIARSLDSLERILHQSAGE